MKSIMFGIVVMLCSLSVFAAQPGTDAGLNEGLVNPGYQEKPDWFKDSFLDIREDVTEASDAEKRVILYFYQDGCPYCDKLLKDNFGNPEIADATRKYFDVIAINMWGDRSVVDFEGEDSTEKNFAAALKVQYTPTLLFLNEAGEVIFRINGYYEPPRFNLVLSYVAGKHEKNGSIQDYYDKLVAQQSSGQDTKQSAAKQPVIADSLPHPLQLKDARAGSGRPLMLVVEQADCAACEELHKDIFTRREVGYALSNLDIAQLDQNSTDTLQTPNGREMQAGEWLKELDIKYTPSLLFFDRDGKEVFRTEGYLKTFHVHGAMDYVIAGAYQWQPEFQRFLQHRTEAMAARGFEVDLLE